MNATTQNLVFLDLEETLIDSWDEGNTLLFNVEKVKSLLTNVGASTVTLGLMSWAVWDSKDKFTFNEKFRKPLEDALGFQFDTNFVWSMEDWQHEASKATGKFLTKEDLFDVCGKQELLFLMRNCKKFTNKHVHLVDDKVDHRLSFHSATNNCVVQFHDVTKML